MFNLFGSFFSRMSSCCSSREKADGLFLRPPGVKVVNYGVLGNSDHQPNVGANAAPPDASVAFVDPAGMHHIQNTKDGPRGASGASGAIYHWLGIGSWSRFPDPVRETITAPLLAKLHVYDSAGGVKINCIHCVGPDFREYPNCTQAEAVDKLSQAYKNIFVQFCDSGLKRLRLLPMSGGVFSGQWSQDMVAFSRITAEAVEKGFLALPPEQQARVEESKLEMCIFMQSQVELFASAFRVPNDRPKL